MDALKNALGSSSDNGAQQQQQQGGGGGGFTDSINSALGGGRAGERQEDYLDKAVDVVQQAMGAGDQSNESAAEQFKDEQISDAIRQGYKSMTGSEVPVADKS